MNAEPTTWSQALFPIIQSVFWCMYAYDILFLNP